MWKKVILALGIMFGSEGRTAGAILGAVAETVESDDELRAAVVGQVVVLDLNGLENSPIKSRGGKKFVVQALTVKRVG